MNGTCLRFGRLDWIGWIWLGLVWLPAYAVSEYPGSSPATSLDDAVGDSSIKAAAATNNIVALFDYNGQRNQFIPQQKQQHFFGTTLNPITNLNGDQQQQQQQSICNCEHHLASEECRLQCLASQQVSTVPSVLVSVAKQNLNENQMITSVSSYVAPMGGTIMTASATAINPSPSSASPATSSSGGKMNPLDVAFLLYTRDNRELAQELAYLGGGVGSQHSNLVSSAATTSPTSISVGGAPTPSLALSNSHGGGGGGGGASSSSTSGDGGESSSGVAAMLDLTNETALNEMRINSSLPIKIIIHGFGSGGRRPWVTDMVYKLLDYEDVNVIVVDWEKGAVLPNYVQAAGNTRIVGHKIATLIKSINAKYGLTGNRYHLIGFSLGAHVAGFAGMEIRNSTNISRHWINRITGLDPASPLFEGYEANDRLDPTDAQFVDVIHSNGDGVLRGGFGSLQPMGHVDFYPNGGRVQVGCNSVILSALSDIIYGKWQSLCNHRRALNFFMDSFEYNKCRFRSFSCDSYENYLKGGCFECGQNNEKCSNMGYLANYSKGRGKMYLTTHEDAPFCANQFIIKIIGSKGHKTHWGKVEVTLVTVDGKNESFWLSSMHSGQSTSTSASSSSLTSASSTSNSYELGASQKELSQQSMQSLIVAHPTLMNFTQILLRYTKYKGWIYSGDESWPIDKVFITDSDGQVKSFCGQNTILESHIITRLSLEPGNCTVSDDQSSPNASTSLTGQATDGALQSSLVSRQSISGPNSGGQPQSNGQQLPVSSQQQSPRTPRLLTSLMHHQASQPGANAEFHHHQQQVSQSPLFMPNGHTVAMQRMLTPHQQYTHQILSF